MSPLLALTLTATLWNPAALPREVEAPLLTQAALLAAAARPPAAPAITARAAWAPPGGDSLRNGAIAGAVAGGVALGGLVGFLCVALDETDGKGDCIAATALYAGIGAAGGAALGAGVDALFTRAPVARVRVRF